MTAEHRRLEEARERSVPWKKWGPYLSERQWGTVREDYSEGGDAWNYFSHDQARSRAYRWGEDGLAGISDDQQRLCFALALWNGKDPILKERLFGLTNSESNHGEDVKEYYFYLDSTPTHSYMKYLYKYPQAAFPYADLVETSRSRGRQRVRVRAARHRRLRRGPLLRRLRRVRQGVARGHPDPDHRPQPRPGAGRAARPADALVPQPVVVARRSATGRCSDRSAATAGCEASSGAIDPELGERYLYCEGDVAAALHRERNEHAAHLRRPEPHALRQGRHQQLRRPRPAGRGESGADRARRRRPHYRLTVDPGECQVDPAAAHRRRARPTCPRATATHGPVRRPLRRGPAGPRAGGRRVLRGRHSRRRSTPTRPTSCGRRWRACSGRKQFYHYDVDKWLEERGSDPFKADAQGRRRATTTGTTCTTATSSRCRTSGSIPGTRPGTSPSTSSP